jgi:DNA-binding MarR family transcriptional regulator
MKAGHDLAMALRTAYLRMHREADARLARLGVTADQFVLLATLARGDAVTQQDLVGRTSSDPNTVRAMLVLLEGRGLVVRPPHPTDGRARSVFLTKKGRRVYERAWAAGEAFRVRLLAAFRADEARALVDYLGRIARVAAPPEGRRRKPAAVAGG